MRWLCEMPGGIIYLSCVKVFVTEVKWSKPNIVSCPDPFRENREGLLNFSERGLGTRLSSTCELIKRWPLNCKNQGDQESAAVIWPLNHMITKWSRPLEGNNQAIKRTFRQSKISHKCFNRQHIVYVKHLWPGPRFLVGKKYASLNPGLSQSR